MLIVGIWFFLGVISYYVNRAIIRPMNLPWEWLDVGFCLFISFFFPIMSVIVNSFILMDFNSTGKPPKWL